MKEKLRMIFCGAPKYREAIYKLIDSEWDCEWFLGRYKTDIKSLNEQSLNTIKWIENKNIGKRFYWQKGVISLLKNRNVDSYLMTGDVYCLSSWCLLIQRRLFYRRRKIYLWTHGWYGREGFIKKIIKRVYFGMSDHIFTYGQYAKSIAISQGIDRHKITPINNSLDYSNQISLREKLISSNIYERHFGNNNLVLLFIGRLTKVKRLDLLMKAISLAKNRGNIYNLILIGDGNQKVELKALANQLNISNQVWFFGESYDDSKNAQLIYDADLCVSPGNVGLTALHAMTFGTPVLTHNDFKLQMPEFETIKAGKTGSFFKKDSVESMYKAILDWDRTHKNRQEVRLSCYEVIDKYWNPKFQLNVLKRIIGKQLSSYPENFYE